MTLVTRCIFTATSVMPSLHLEPLHVLTRLKLIKRRKEKDNKKKKGNIVASGSNLIRLFSSEPLKTGIHLISTSL